MRELEVRKALTQHVTASRQLLQLRKGVTPDELAEYALCDLRARCIQLGWLLSRRDLDDEYRRMARHLMELSRQLMRLKSREFALAGSFPELEAEEPDDLDGGAAVYAVVTPPPRPRFGKDAKPFPEEE